MNRVSWSLIPGIGFRRLMSEGRFVKNKSSVALFLVWKSTICCRPISSTNVQQRKLKRWATRIPPKTGGEHRYPRRELVRNHAHAPWYSRKHNNISGNQNAQGVNNAFLTLVEDIGLQQTYNPTVRQSDSPTNALFLWKLTLLYLYVVFLSSCVALPIVCPSMISCFRCSGPFFGE
jgi:hypothetical protein